MKKFFVISYFTTLALLFLYSYTQIDLSLTFSRIDFLRELVKSFQHIGYFNRPLSTFIFIMLVVFLLNFYLGFLIMALTKQINKKFLWRTIIIAAIILAFSYNAFSHDLFNYMFDAKIITHYHANPYSHKALDFPQDPMLSFMHWTHRTYPYGPAWLVLTTPLSYLGANYFIPTFLLFKLLMAGSFIGTVYFIGKILEKISPKHYLSGLVFFALNPLVLIESLISAHIDIVMLFFFTSSLYYLIIRKYIFAILLFLVSIGIKFVTASLIPIFLLIVFLQITNKKINWDKVFLLSLILISSTAIYVSQLSNFQPWYLLGVILIGTFVARKYFVFIPVCVISTLALFNYVPHLFIGNWDHPVPQIISFINISSYIISGFIVATYFFIQRKHKKNIT